MPVSSSDRISHSLVRSINARMYSLKSRRANTIVLRQQNLFCSSEVRVSSPDFLKCSNNWASQNRELYFEVEDWL